MRSELVRLAVRALFHLVIRPAAPALALGMARMASCSQWTNWIRNLPAQWLHFRSHQTTPPFQTFRRRVASRCEGHTPPTRLWRGVLPSPFVRFSRMSKALPVLHPHLKVDSNASRGCRATATTTVSLTTADLFASLPLTLRFFSRQLTFPSSLMLTRAVWKQKGLFRRFPTIRLLRVERAGMSRTHCCQLWSSMVESPVLRHRPLQRLLSERHPADLTALSLPITVTSLFRLEVSRTRVVPVPLREALPSLVSTSWQRALVPRLTSLASLLVTLFLPCLVSLPVSTSSSEAARLWRRLARPSLQLEPPSHRIATARFPSCTNLSLRCLAKLFLPH